jgi:hypothetical protein
MLAEVFEIKGKKSFTLLQAKGILPIIKRVTARSYKKIQKLGVQSTFIQDPETKKQIDALMEAEFKNWQIKISKLGGIPKGMWLVDFDYGNGFYCWQFPENDISHFHDYQNGFQGRIPLQ